MCRATPRSECDLQVSWAAPSQARAFLRQASCPVHQAEVLEDAVLLVSELVTNSVMYGGPPLVVAVDCDEAVMQVRVRDGSPHVPELREPAVSDERGRGLALVAKMSDAWGVENDPDDGKFVWFALRAQR